MEPWIEVVDDGHVREVGLQEALVGADRLAGLAVVDPLETVAVLRQVLVPIVMDAVGVPEDRAAWARWFARGRFDDADAARIGDYLDAHADRFDLFDGRRPFAQVAGLRTAKDETKPVSLLLSRLASGNNVPLFSARTESDPPSLSPAAAARALLAAQCWDTAAIKSGAADDPQVKAGKTTGNPTGPLGQLGVVVPMGATLFDTLMLNLPIIPLGARRSDDHPQWKSPTPADMSWQVRPARGMLDLLTWQARRIRLIPQVDASVPGGVVVRRVVLCAGDRLTGPFYDLEPHAGWRQVEKPKKGDPPVRPVRHQPGRAAWRGLAGLLAVHGPTAERLSAPAQMQQVADLQADGAVPDDFPLRVLTVGVSYGTQSAVVDDVIVDEIPLPVVGLAADSQVRYTLLQVAEQAEALRIAANRLGDDLRAACGAAKLPWDRGQRLGDLLIHRLTPVVRRLLAGLQHHPEAFEQAEDAWRIVARRLAWEVADPVLSAAGPETFLGRDPDQRFGPRLAVAEASFRRSLHAILGPAPTGISPSASTTTA
ncbi:type I-E CRISPR-associated protein Cse1/CasA [Frankia sp. R82]|uniref:type I-E CRISPR-associated protein Cse1/CasA n=1 Tax=Frankia sp. R82 TaxID=2950553 RepID=UPI002044445E|nr:type I-E CRISPR-associated protein Cse1/CasA [Frankia sp. R82]MCM3884612.1 type I-E CRISPR-associated protein Cse1/CasA [Frankia sp. R82]